MKPVTVSQVTEYISGKLKNDISLHNLVMSGEISGISRSGKHIYLTLKDSKAAIRANIWSSYIPGIDSELLKDGVEVVVVGDISPYAKNGSYSFSIKHMEGKGIGDLAAEFNRIKAMLETEGLFDEKYKKPIPEFPRRVGVITSDTGAAIEDIKRTITRKNTYVDIIIFPTQVQGIGAPVSICSNIKLANSLNASGELSIDVLIVGRGGGSAEDLAAFNDESVARTVFDSDIPIISAVGHESDFSICDFVSDYRAATPTAAAEKAVPDTYRLERDIADYRNILLSSLYGKLEYNRTLLNSQIDLIYTTMLNKVQSARSELEKILITLNENNPKNILSKGYVLVSNNENKLVTSAEKMKFDEEYSLTFSDGDVKIKVL